MVWTEAPFSSIAQSGQKPSKSTIGETAKLRGIASPENSENHGRRGGEVADQAGQCPMPAPHGHVQRRVLENFAPNGFRATTRHHSAQVAFSRGESHPTQATWRVRQQDLKTLTGWTLQEIWPSPPVRVTARCRKPRHLGFRQGHLRGVFLGSPRDHGAQPAHAGASWNDVESACPCRMGLVGAAPPAMVLLQFGGNAVPGMTQPKQARWYAQNMGRWFATFASISHLPWWCSSARLTWGFVPGLPRSALVIEALAKEIPEAGGLFWDLQSAMGGPGSMADWMPRDGPRPTTFTFPSEGHAKLQTFRTSTVARMARHTQITSHD